jgi:hypothetical protein
LLEKEELNNKIWNVFSSGARWPYCSFLPFSSLFSSSLSCGCQLIWPLNTIKLSLFLLPYNPKSNPSFYLIKP